MIVKKKEKEKKNGTNLCSVPKMFASIVENRDFRRNSTKNCRKRANETHLSDEHGRPALVEIHRTEESAHNYPEFLLQ